MSSAEYAVVINQQSQFLKKLAFKLARQTEEAEDLIQDTIEKALLNQDKYQLGSNLKGWLYTIMRNTFINKYRKRKFQNTYTDSSENQFYINQYEGSNNSKADALVDKAYIMQHVNALEDNYKVTFLMHFEGYKYEEIAEELNVPLGTVKSRIFLARKKLSSALSDYRFIKE